MAALASKVAAQLQSGALASKVVARLQSGPFASTMSQVRSKAAQQLQSGPLASTIAQVQSKAAQLQSGEFASKVAELQSTAYEAARSAAKQGSAYQKELQSKACEATRFAAKQGSEYHKTLMERNKQYIVDPPTIENCQELSKQLFYTRLASLPVRYQSFWKETDGAKLLLKNRKDLKVEDMGVAALFGLELYAWLRVGEIVGRGFTLTGYHV